MSDKLYDFAMPVQARYLPRDWQYPLYAAFCTKLNARLPEGIGFRYSGSTIHLPNDRIEVMPGANLVFRCTSEFMPLLLGLVNVRFDVAGEGLRLGMPSVFETQPSPKLFSRIVTFKDAKTAPEFKTVVDETLERMDVRATPILPCHPDGNPIKRIVRIRGVKIVGFRLVLEGLSDSDSLKILRHGLGGRRHMGCGVFVPCR